MPHILTAMMLVLCMPAAAMAVAPPTPSPAAAESADIEVELPDLFENLRADLSNLGPLSLTDPEFWVELTYTAIDYSPWTPETNSFSGEVIEKVASVMGLFSTSRRYRISSRFGPRFHPILKKNRQHNGIDMAAPRGTPVLAVQDGTVDYASRRGAYGKFVEIDHEGPWETQYAHLSKISVLPGEDVEQGDRIGKVGTTGRSTGPHLHFVVLKDGVPIDPLSAEGFYYISPIVPLSYNLALLKREEQMNSDTDTN